MPLPHGSKNGRNDPTLGLLAHTLFVMLARGGYELAWGSTLVTVSSYIFANPDPGLRMRAPCTG